MSPACMRFATCDTARLWSSRIIAVNRAAGMSGAWAVPWERWCSPRVWIEIHLEGLCVGTIIPYG